MASAAPVAPPDPHLFRPPYPPTYRAPETRQSRVRERPAGRVQQLRRKVWQVQGHLVTAGACEGGEVAAFHAAEIVAPRGAKKPRRRIAGELPPQERRDHLNRTLLRTHLDVSKFIQVAPCTRPPQWPDLCKDPTPRSG